MFKCFGLSVNKDKQYIKLTAIITRQSECPRENEFRQQGLGILYLPWPSSPVTSVPWGTTLHNYQALGLYALGSLSVLGEQHVSERTCKVRKVGEGPFPYFTCDSHTNILTQFKQTGKEEKHVYLLC